MMTETGTKIIQHIFEVFRVRYTKRYPGCNANDVERAFLCKMCYHFSIAGDDIVKRIESIR